MTVNSAGSERTLTRLIKEKAAREKERTFLYFKDEEYSFQTLHQNSNRIANGLKNIGVKQGDFIVSILPNAPEYLYIWWGISKIGAVEVPINNNYRGETLADLINRSDAKVAFVWNNLCLDRFLLIKNDLKNIKHVILSHRLHEKMQTDTFNLNPDLSWHSLEELMQNPADDPSVEIYCNDPLSLVYTSGTTGPPKGVLINHHFLIHSINMNKYIGTSRDDILYNVYPMYNLSGQHENAVRALLAGGQMVLAEKFAAENFWHDIIKYGCTEFVTMGGTFALVAKQPPGINDRDNTLKKVFGFPLPPDFRAKCEQRFGIKMMGGYGSTEVGYNTIETWKPAKIGSCGQANCGYEVKIFDDRDRECPPNTEGEIVVRPAESPFTMIEYYKMPELFARRARGFWWHTGDLGKMDEDGYLYFIRRKEESIRFRGYLVSVTEVEKIVSSHPAVLESACYGVADELGQEQDVMVAVKLRPGEKIVVEEIISHCEKNLPYFMIPCYVRFIEEFEKTPTMRIIKANLINEGVTNDTWDRRTTGYKLSRKV